MILETKLNLPQPKAGALLRTALIERIKNNLDKKLILITAGAGYGKTTLLAQLVRHKALPAVYYNLDGGDSDLRTFFSYLVGGLEKLSPGLAVRSAVLLQPDASANNHELLMGTLINELVEKRHGEIFFIFDDCQNLAGDSPVLQALEYFIDHLPESVHVIIASRVVIQFSALARWMVKRDAWKLTNEHLAFKDEEVRALLSQNYNRILAEDELKYLLHQTEGWITGINLILSHARELPAPLPLRDVIGTYRKTGRLADIGLYEYFAGEILARETELQRNQMIQLSILDVITPRACAGIMQIADAGIFLSELEKRQAFLIAVGKEEYRYHPLFRDFLSKQLRDDAVVKDLHCRAAKYFLTIGDFEKAVGHYLRADEYGQACQAALKAANQLEVNARFTTLDYWFQRIPPQVLDDFPELLIYKAALCRSRGNYQDAENIYIHVERLINARRRQNKKHHDDRSLLSRSLLRHSQLLWRFGRIEQTFVLLGRAMRNCPKKNAELRMNILNLTGLAWMTKGEFRKAERYYQKAMHTGAAVPGKGMMGVKNNLAVLYFDRGEMKPAQGLFTAIYDALVISEYCFGDGQMFANIARSAIAAGDVVQAERCLTAGWKRCEPFEDPLSHAALYNSFGLLCMQKAEWEQARQYFTKAHETFLKAGWESGAGRAQRNLGKLFRYMGSCEQAGNVIEQAMKQAGGADRYINVGLQRQLAQICVSLGQYEKAGMIVRKYAAVARRLKMQEETFYFILAEAAICLSRGRRPRALHLLATAVKMSRLKGYDGMLTMELRHDPGLAALAWAGNVEPAYLGRVKQLIAGIAGAKTGRHDLKAHFFGTLRLTLADGREVPLEWRSRKVESIFAYLIMHRSRICSRSELMEAVWPGVRPELAAQNLHKAASLIKKALKTGLARAGEYDLAQENIIEHHANGYGINPRQNWQLDCEEFQKKYQAAQLTLLSAGPDSGQAEQLYAGCLGIHQDGFLPGLEEAWCFAKRDEFEKTYLSCLKNLAGLKTAQRDFEEAVIHYHQYLSRQPFAEDVRVEMWEALKAIGRINIIKEDYWNFKKALKKEMGVNPQVKTETRYRELVRSNS